MLFNSLLFIFIFLPLVLGLYYLALKRHSPTYILCVLTVSSLLFYAYWYPPYLVLLLISIGVNYSCGHALGKRTARQRKLYLLAGILLNLGLLAHFKYAGFFIENVNMLLGQSWSVLHVALPLGISFFTFQQIAYLVDVYKNKVARSGFLEYVLFVTFFPQLIAGPIIHYKDIAPQFRFLKEQGFQKFLFSSGCALFSIGLFKKVLLADSLAPHADPLFSAVENGYTPSFLEAWGATLSYCFQIYFDFSGYTDMALGLALLFGIRLPANFNAPYKATGYIEFWRRWHITLSHFLRDYLYIPLGGNKNGSLRKYQNLVVTMLIGGLWHGANWNFVIWGGVHGILIAINHGLRRYFVLSSGVWALSGWFFTFLSVSLLWVLFRAESFVGASVIYSAMFNLGDITLPSNVWNIIPAYAQSVFSSLGMQPGSLQYFKTVPLFTVLLSAALISFLFPNTPSLFRLEVPEKDQSLIGNKWRFIPNARWALLCAAMFILSVSLLQRESPFLYFQF